MTTTVGQVVELFRYPIKSIGGERLTSAEINRRGLVGDRFWAVEDEEGKFGSGKTTRRFRRMEGLLEFRAFLRDGPDVPMLALPDGAEVLATSPEATAALRERTGQQVAVTAEREVSHFDEGALHLLTTSALGRLAQVHGAPVDVRRLRNNITLDTSPAQGHLEEEWVGRHLALGEELIVEIAYLMPRCVMVNMAQHDLPEDNRVLKSISEINPDVCLGAFAQVVQPGIVRLGDTARLV
ncbi:uncharacterized protein YcbX [Deinococcus sp. HSC-46F16]|uniref:MOSC domain-containing protein n=1 Tax=Deinococcus sp. HSC-46F16 TaxID=2910968 RepID=UPI00209D89B1|nr:MOSC N-terminal beta barrel domain-containing protein [Deinococcus sp. HSC-46F16]MCP2015162.1 uncharacterized protein YcbX [Deinococcus sp. HSC-46F16]